MKKILFVFLLLFTIFGLAIVQTHAQTPTPAIEIPPECSLGSCPTDLIPLYTQKGEKCANTYAEFKQAPTTSHYWIEDQQITTQGKADERARQFIYWAISKNAIDDHPVLKSIWNNTRNVAYFVTLLVAAILGLGLIISQRTHFETGLKVWPIVGKIAGVLLAITFSASIVIVCIQLSEIFMKFFTESVGGANLFNIFFSSKGNESNYTSFIGCRDLNYRVQEGVGAEVFMLKLTNVTYYVMGVMLILRKIILWFLLFLSPFVPILFTFPTVKNTGWIWVGVFFQWLFYGPLFALFLGAITVIWKVGLPFTFNFSRAGTPGGYVYPTGINILYGGPAQKLGALSNGNYVDTFVEYIITLIMLWVATLLPWLLLRIFRDYCCDSINASKNILLSMYDHMRNGSPMSPVSPSGITGSTGIAMKLPKEIEQSVKVKLETVEEIHRTKTEDITKSLNLQATKLTDVAHFETNKTTQETVRKNLDLLSNPVRAETPTQRQQFMNLRTELFNRAVKEDHIARQVLVATSSSKGDQYSKRQEFLKTTQNLVPVSHIVSVKVHLPQEKISSVNNSFIEAVGQNVEAVNSLAKSSQVSVSQVHSVLQAYKQNASGSSFELVNQIAKETGVSKKKVVAIIKQTAEESTAHANITKQTALKEQVSESQVNAVMSAQIPLVTEPEKNIEQSVSIPPTVSIEDYEEVKKMWIEQYEKGEVPVTENIISRKQWVEQDVVFITNTLNKLFSTDPAMKQQGLDDLSYILPIFLINDLKGDELAVYLKAKLEAAKQVSQSIDKEKDIAARLKDKATEEFVDVKNTKTQTKEKTMEMKEEMQIEEPKKE